MNTSNTAEALPVSAIMTVALLDEHYAAASASTHPAPTMPAHFCSVASSRATRAAGLRTLQKAAATTEFQALPLNTYVTRISERAGVPLAAVLPALQRSGEGLVRWVRLAIDAGIQKSQVSLLARLQLAIARSISPNLAMPRRADRLAQSVSPVPPSASVAEVEAYLCVAESGYARETREELSLITENCR